MGEVEDSGSGFDSKTGDRVSPTFCVLPWVHRFTNIGGEVQVCCVSEEYDNNNRDENGLKINVNRIQDDEILMNTEFMRKLRVQLMKGEWPNFCERCKQTENGGGFSRRQIENFANKMFITRMINDTQPDGKTKVKIRSVDFRLGNTCNLACRMCNPRSSSKWIKDWSKVDQNWFGKSDEELDSFRRFKYYENPDVWGHFKRQIPSLRHLHFAGGEPMVVRQMLEAMKMCVSEGYSRSISVSYNTNVTTIPDEVKELWPKFHRVRIYASIDAFGKLNDYIRHPSNWETIRKNLNDLEENYDKYRMGHVMVACTAQVYNITQVHHLFKYLGDSFERVMPIPQLFNLYHPFHYRTQILPPQLKALAKKNLLEAKSFAEKLMQDRPAMRKFLCYLNSVDEAIHFMEMEDRQNLLPEFLRAALSKDKFRKENLFSLLPEFELLRKNQSFQREQTSSASPSSF